MQTACSGSLSCASFVCALPSAADRKARRLRAQTGTRRSPLGPASAESGAARSRAIGDQAPIEKAKIEIRATAGDTRSGIVHGRRPLSLRLLAFRLFVVERGRCARLFGESETRRIFEHPTHRPVLLSSRALAEGAQNSIGFFVRTACAQECRTHSRTQIRSVTKTQNKTRRLAASNRSVVRTSDSYRVWRRYDARKF
jgi:hypothetical protein